MDKQVNPFYRQHVFSSADLERSRLTRGDRLRVLFRPMYVQITDGYAVHYKTLADGRMFVFKCEELPPVLGITG